MHVHASVLHGTIFLAYLLIWMFLLRSFAAMVHDKPLGRALGFIIG